MRGRLSQGTSAWELGEQMFFFWIGNVLHHFIDGKYPYYSGLRLSPLVWDFVHQMYSAVVETKWLAHLFVAPLAFNINFSCQDLSWFFDVQGRWGGRESMGSLPECPGFRLVTSCNLPCWTVWMAHACLGHVGSGYDIVIWLACTEHVHFYKWDFNPPHTGIR